jgi:hypothetical protein
MADRRQPNRRCTRRLASFDPRIISYPWQVSPVRGSRSKFDQFYEGFAVDQAAAIGNVAVKRIAPSPFDRRQRSSALRVSADAAILKGDLAMAQRLLIQADVDDPRNPYPEERLTWLDRELNRFEALKSSTQQSGRKFDFLYAPTLRGLSTELSSLPLHPDVFSVPKHELDHAIDGQHDTGLLAKYQESFELPRTFANRPRAASFHRRSICRPRGG